MQNEIYDLAVKVAQRLYFGSAAHHPHLASFWEMLGIPQMAEEQRKSAEEEFGRKLLLDKLIVKETGKFPLYSMPNWTTMANVVSNVSPEQIKANPKQYMKAAIDNMKEYEEGTLKMFEEIKEKAKGAGGKFEQLLAKLVQNVQKEIEQIKADKEALEKLDYEKEKILKGEHRMDRRGRGYGMDRYADDRYDDRRGRRMMDDYDDRRQMDRYDDMRMMDEMDDDRRRGRYADDDYDDHYPMMPYADDDRYMDRYDDDDKRYRYADDLPLLEDARRGRRRGYTRVRGYTRRR